MSIWGIGIATAGSLAGGMMQGNAAEGAAGISAEQAAQNAKAYTTAQGQNDALLTAAEKQNQQAYNPYAQLGTQGTNALSQFMGIETPYGVAQPKAPRTWQQIQRDEQAAWQKKHPGGKIAHPEVFAANAKKTAQQERATYDADLAKWTQDRDAFSAQQRTTESFGDYFSPYEEEVAEPKYESYGVAAPTYEAYGVAEPTYTPYKDYEPLEYKEFTRDDLESDPIYQTELDENVGAWDKSAASRGSLMSGNTVAGLREMTADGISRARGRHVEDYGINRDNSVQDYDIGRTNYLQDYGIGHDEWQSAFDRNVQDYGLRRAAWEGDYDRYNQDYGIRHDEWQGGYDRDWNEGERQYNALTDLSTMGLGVTDRRVGLRTDTANNRVQNRQWSTAGSTGSAQQAADANASGRLASGTAWGNAFNNVGQMGMLYGAGAFDKTQSYTLGGRGTNKPNFTVRG